MVTVGNALYISVTNTGRIYKLDISKPETISQMHPVKWLDIPGPNGIVIVGNSMYIDSIPPYYTNMTDQNVIYKVADCDYYGE